MSCFEVPQSSFKTNYFRYDSSGQEVLEAMGLGLWLGEGSRYAKHVEVTNTDPEILKLWVTFLTSVCNVAPGQIKVRINLHDPSTEEEVKAYWDEVLGAELPKTVRAKKVVTENPKNKQLMGTLSVRFNSKFLRSHIGLRAYEVVGELNVRAHQRAG